LNGSWWESTPSSLTRTSSTKRRRTWQP
jgi:hypothetical protein